jgi:hypothetical protein
MKEMFGIAALFTLAINQSYAAHAHELTSLPCGEATLDYNSRQRWQPGHSQYGIQYEQWTPEAFNMLRERAVECSNPDAQAFVAYMNYLEEINANALQAMEANRQQNVLAEEEAKRKAQLEAERARQLHVAAEAARKQQQAAEEAERKRLAEEEVRKKADLQGQRAGKQQHAAEEAERKRLGELEASALSDDHEPQPEEAIMAQALPWKPKLPLDADVQLFLQNNPGLTLGISPLSDDGLLILESIIREQAVILLALQLCTERWTDFPGYLEEAQRRIELLERVGIQIWGYPADKVASFRASANQIFDGTQTTDYLLADPNSLYEICQRSLFEISNGKNFAQ